MTFAMLRVVARHLRSPLKKHSLLTNSDRPESNLFNELCLHAIEQTQRCSKGAHHNVANKHKTGARPPSLLEDFREVIDLHFCTHASMQGFELNGKRDIRS